MAKTQQDNFSRALHRIACGLHSVSQTRRLSSTERAVYVMAQRALTPEVTVDSIMDYLGR